MELAQKYPLGVVEAPCCCFGDGCKLCCCHNTKLYFSSAIGERDLAHLRTLPEDEIAFEPDDDEQVAFSFEYRRRQLSGQERLRLLATPVLMDYHYLIPSRRICCDFSCQNCDALRFGCCVCPFAGRCSDGVAQSSRLMEFVVYMWLARATTYSFMSTLVYLQVLIKTGPSRCARSHRGPPPAHAGPAPGRCATPIPIQSRNVLPFPHQENLRPPGPEPGGLTPPGLGGSNRLQPGKVEKSLLRRSLANSIFAKADMRGARKAKHHEITRGITHVGHVHLVRAVDASHVIG